jgi:glycosyltransferase involved in cell wall biosynthesis
MADHRAFRRESERTAGAGRGARLIKSIHVLGSRQFGGADQFFVRLVQALGEAGHPTLAVTRVNSPAAAALAESGSEQMELPLANGWDLYSRWRIRRIVAERGPDIVQTYMGRASRLTRLPRTKRAVHLARLGGYYKIRGYYEHADGWIGNTRGVCDYLAQSGLPADRIWHIGNFVPEPAPCGADNLARIRVQHDLPEDAWLVFTLGRFIDIKGFDDLLEALALLPAEIGGRTPHLMIAGDGPMKQTLRQLAGRLGLVDRVTWIGWCDDPTPYFRLCDLMVCPSRRETLGNVILEAWRHECAVVTTMTPGATEIATDGETAWLCPVRTPSALAESIHAALEAPPAERERRARAGYETVIREHSREAIVGAYLDLYENLCG